MLQPRWLALLLLVWGLAHAQAPVPRAPEAARVEHLVKSPHGERRDDYHWLRDDDTRSKRASVLRHLEAENRYTDSVLAPLRTLRDRIQQEIVARVKGDDSTLPVYDHGWWVWQQFEPGVDHPKLMRRRGTPERPDPAARPEVLLDMPQQAIAQRYYALGRAEVSPDGQWLAWTEDVLGRGSYDLYVQNLRTRRLQPERIRGVLQGFVWAGDSKNIFYVRHQADNLHTGSVWRHERGRDPADDVRVHDEPDPTLFVELRASASRQQVLIDIHGTDTAELRAVPAAMPDAPAQVVFRRQAGVRLHVDHLAGRWVVRTNEGAPNFRLVSVPEATPEQRATWRDLVPARGDVQLEAFAVFDQALAVEERAQARRRVRVIAADGRTLRVVDGGEASDVALGDNRDPSAAQVQVVSQSLVRPPATIDVHLASGRDMVRRQEQLQGLDASLYRTRQIDVKARDGAAVPVTLAWRQDRARADGQAPLVIEVYGAYGIPFDLTFGAHRLSLLDRGFVVAVAHVRGGSERGQAWYEAGRLMHKHRSFDDFVDVTDALVEQKWGHPEKVFAQGASAGGLVVAVAANEAGGRYRGMALDVPFVDVVSTLLDPTIPLTANEWGQWGDPRRKADHDYLLSYSPYDNIAARDYPAMIVTTALWDTLVPYFEPAKYVAKLRATKTDSQPLLLHVEMDAGHAGAAGRFERPRHWARQYALFLDWAGLANAPGATAVQPEATRSIKLTR